MDTSDYYALGIPLFALLMAAEAWALRRRGRTGYHAADTISNLGCGLGQILFGILAGPAVLLLYGWFLRRFAIVEWPEGSYAVWIVAFLGVDFCYYWFHRFGHEIAGLWTIHSVHHQSEAYNLSVALRQTWFSDVSAIFFYWPLPLLGVPEVPFFGAVALLSLYQVTLHTEILRKPGRYGLIFNTPSHHRVHHATNDAYRDKNYGATLIVWDRVFGTFCPETEPPMYGVTPAIRTADPVAAQFVTLRELIRRTRAVTKPVDKLRLWFGRERLGAASGASGWGRARVGMPTLLAAIMVGAFACVLLVAQHRLELAPTIVGAVLVVVAMHLVWRTGERERR